MAVTLQQEDAKGFVTYQVKIQQVETIPEFLEAVMSESYVKINAMAKEYEKNRFKSFTINEVKDKLSCSPKTVKRLIDEEKLKLNKDGKVTYASLVTYQDNL